MEVAKRTLVQTYRVDDVTGLKVLRSDKNLLRSLIALGLASVDGDVHALRREMIIVTYR